ncbi:hypothetical protein DAPPUDRAFT_346185 [Daphnia pulex]|uniref:Conjugal transfer protein TrbJ n=1 Tax=Daphnia pulex TaxID=6669 RepID=E9I7S6_DAPPU|nr:hypothetical protein DAPPUDRAFT_346185 [Daphnia pulex]|eukprot:EFX59954.1 hypothetical protein DAPPUDRAFT_346185 [Daphnia pulex]
MNIIKRIAVCAVAMITASVSITSSAQIPVTDVAGLVQNTVTAGKAVITEINTATSAIQNIRQTILLIKSLTSLEGLAQLTGLQEELALFQDLRQTGMELQSTFNQMGQLTNDVKASFGSVNFSWKNFSDGTFKGNLNKAKTYMNRFDAMNKSIEAANKKRQLILNQLQRSDGSIAAAAQATTASIDNLTGQVNQMVSHFAVQEAQASDNLKRQTEAAQIQDDIFDKYQKRMKDSADKVTAPYSTSK